MIGKLKGKVDSSNNDHAIIDVGGVGYLVYASAKVLSKLAENDHCQLYIETHVREDHIHLYGFLSIEEKSFFTLLQSVNGIGPRMALSILSHLTPEQIHLAVSQRDKEIFTHISGVGPKLAERIIIELKGKVKTNLTINPDSRLGLSTYPSTDNASDAILALVALGINKLEAQNTVSVLAAKYPDASIDELIRNALKTRAQ